MKYVYETNIDDIKLLHKISRFVHRFNNTFNTVRDSSIPLETKAHILLVYVRQTIHMLYEQAHLPIKVKNALGYHVKTAWRIWKEDVGLKPQRTGRRLR